MERFELYSEGLVAEALEAVTQDLSKNWPDLMQRLAASMPDGPSAPAETVRQMGALLQDARFLALPDSWNVLHFVLSNWEWFPEPAREELARLVLNAFDRFSHYMGAFLASEILGEKCADGLALERVLELSRTATMPSRSLVPHGLECLARTTSDPVCGNALWRRLRASSNPTFPRCGTKQRDHCNESRKGAEELDCIRSTITVFASTATRGRPRAWPKDDPVHPREQSRFARHPGGRVDVPK